MTKTTMNLETNRRLGFILNLVEERRVANLAPKKALRRKLGASARAGEMALQNDPHI